MKYKDCMITDSADDDEYDDFVSVGLFDGVGDNRGNSLGHKKTVRIVFNCPLLSLLKLVPW